ncbi:hypothetical protein RhiirC2_730829 [Rhizophagus irregularis]|uniref:Uncharacterized protein n=2 Tax=Rhizophagus irregularis TaxID=588596 RepID=A0A2N1NW48_9GLOM|nr:hypothetical protein RhiirC2_730829 [Rhizophagus irregularis]
MEEQQSLDREDVLSLITSYLTYLTFLKGLKGYLGILVAEKVEIFFILEIEIIVWIGFFF